MKTPQIALLDHGYVRLVESYGSDQSIIEAARMSTDKGFLGWGPKHDIECRVFDHAWSGDDPYPCSCVGGPKPGDEKLLRYLYEKKHSTPFEMAGLIIEVQAPIFVFREWHRHRTQSYSEMSARYTPLPDLNYVPSISRLMIGSDGVNRQAGTIAGSKNLTQADALDFQHRLRRMYEDQQAVYEWALQHGVPKELARVHLPVGRYSKMRAHANLRNWLAFLTLRMAPDAQWEIREYANAVGALVKEIYPRTWSLFVGDP